MSKKKSRHAAKPADPKSRLAGQPAPTSSPDPSPASVGGAEEGAGLFSSARPPGADPNAGPSCGPSSCGGGAPSEMPSADLLPPDPAPKRTGLALKLEEWLGLDIRALAAFRVAIALIVLFDLGSRAWSITAHYTDAGVLPRADLIARVLTPERLSLHLAGGSAMFEGAMFLLAALFAMALLVGWRTRWALLGLLILTVSLQGRNPRVLNAGDTTLRLLMFWGMFLPLGARFSFDAAMNTGPQAPKRVLSIGTAALIFQICVVYWTTAYFKIDPIWFQDYTAVYYALHIDQFATFLAPIARETIPLSVLKAICFAVIWLETLGPFLLFSPWRPWVFRSIAVFLFLGLHLSFVAFMKLGIFPFVSCAAWLALLPTEFWDRLGARARTPARLGIKVWYDGECAFCLKMARVCREFFLFPETPIRPCQWNSSILNDMRRENSWVLEDAEKKRLYKFEGMAFLCRMSPIFWPFAWLLRLPFIATPGRIGYEWVANNRFRAASLVKWLRYRPLRWKLSRAGSVAALFFLILVYLLNVRTLLSAQEFDYPPRFLRRLASTLQLTQRWNMFAPRPVTRDGWHVIAATLADGRQVDLFRDGAPLTWERPALMSSIYGNQRWRKYMSRIAKTKKEKLIPLTVDYFKRAWEKGRPASERVVELELCFMLERTPPPGQPFEPIKKTVLFKKKYSEAQSESSEKALLEEVEE